MVYFARNTLRCKIWLFCCLGFRMI
uniref:Uncharacterized protein n=1 Tax=Anguilla anguilla TaxID=7936 RepID=A0A0E9PDQ9_ANGAN